MKRKWYGGLFGVALCSLGFLGGCGTPPMSPNDINEFVVTDPAMVLPIKNAGAGLQVPVVDSIKTPVDMVLPIKLD
jgi:hypothetical protein